MTPASLMPRAWSARVASTPGSSGWKLPPPSKKASTRKKFGKLNPGGAGNFAFVVQGVE